MAESMFSGATVSSKRILYTPSDFARRTLIHLQEIGKLKAQSRHVNSRAHLDSYLFFIVISGSGTLTYNGTGFALGAGDCVFIDCRYPYSHETSDDLWTLCWIHFNGPTVESIYAKYEERGGLPVIRNSDTKKYLSLWERLYEVASSEDYIRDMRVNEALNCLLTLTMEDSWSAENISSGSKKHELMEIKRHLDKNYAKKIYLDELSEQFFINKYYLTRIFKEQFGMSVTTYLTQVRITHAKQLLRFTKKSTEEIAQLTGMGAAHYLSRTFKKIEGKSPSQYREEWQS